MIVNVFTIDISTVNGGYTPTENPISRGFMTHALNELMGIPVQNIYIYIPHYATTALFSINERDVPFWATMGRIPPHQFDENSDQHLLVIWNYVKLPIMKF